MSAHRCHENSGSPGIMFCGILVHSAGSMWDRVLPRACLEMYNLCAFKRWIHYSNIFLEMSDL